MMECKMKVVHFILSLSMGGAETLVKDYALSFDKKKIDLTILCLYRQGAPYEKILEDNNINVVYLSDKLPISPNKVTRGSYGYAVKRSINYICGCLLTRGYIRRLKPDVVHFHLSLNKYVRWANIKKNVRLFYTVHNEPKKIWSDDGEPQKYEYECAKRLIGRNNMRLIALHEAMRVELNEMFGVDNTIVVNNGIDFSRFKVDESRESIRQKIGISTDAFVIGHVGRIAEQKNPSFLIDIFDDIHKKNPKAHLLMVGDGSLKDEITEKIRKMNLSDSVTILKNRTDVPELMRAMNRFVFPSLYEGLAVVLVEAQRMHLPCIVSSNVADYTIITNLVIKKSLDDSASDWADTIIKFDADENNIDDGLMEQWDIKNVCRRLVDIYMGKL